MKSSNLFLLLAVLVPTAVCVDLAPVLGQVAIADNSDEIDPGFGVDPKEEVDPGLGVSPDEKPETKEEVETTLVIETPGSYQVTNKDGVPWTSITITGDIDDSSSKGQTTVQFNNGSIDPPIINNATIKSSWGTTEGQSGDFGGAIKLVSLEGTFINNGSLIYSGGGAKSAAFLVTTDSADRTSAPPSIILLENKGFD